MFTLVTLLCENSTLQAELSAHFRTKFRLIKLLAGDGRSPHSTSFGVPLELPAGATRDTAVSLPPPDGANNMAQRAISRWPTQGLFRSVSWPRFRKQPRGTRPQRARLELVTSMQGAAFIDGRSRHLIDGFESCRLLVGSSLSNLARPLGGCAPERILDILIKHLPLVPSLDLSLCPWPLFTSLCLLMQMQTSTLGRSIIALQQSSFRLPGGRSWPDSGQLW